MKLGFSTLVCPQWTAREIAENAAQYGLDGVELSARHVPSSFTPELDKEQRAQLRGMFDGSGVEIAMVNAYTNFISRDVNVREENIQMVKDFVVLARDLNSKRVRVFGQNKAKKLPDDIPSAESIGYVAEAITEVADFSAAFEIEILLETHDVFCEPELIVEVMSKIKAPNVGVIWDVTNSLRTGKTVHEAYSLIKDFIRYVQVKDYHEVQTLHRPCLIGEGENPCKEAVALLKSAGFEGYFSLETEKQYHPEPEVAEPEVSLPQFVETMHRYLGERSE
jgi:sugar phosphate isomerase/epimerase